MSKTIIFKKIISTQISKDIENFLNSNNLPKIVGFTSPILLKHIKTLTELMFLYMHDTRYSVVAYSGGKDSTVALDMKLKALLLIKYIYGKKKLSKKSYVMFSDTFMELDPVINGINASLKNVQDFAIENELNVQVEKVAPVVKDRFFSLIIGKGYILPSSNTRRYCTERLKIKPQEIAINKLVDNNGKFIAITGQRQDESIDRKNRMEAQTIEGSFKAHNIKGCALYAPIEHFTSDDVWNYIYTSSMSWVDKDELGRVYSEATLDDGDECRSLLFGTDDGGSSPNCGKSSRFGCWICPLHMNKDKTLNALGKHYPYLQKMEEFRNWMISDAEGKWDYKRDVFIHGKHKMKEYDFDNHRKGMMLPGGYNLYYRQSMLSELMKLEREIYPEKKEYLITDEELAYIQEIWIEDGDMDFKVLDYAHHRNVKISKKYKRVVEAAETMLTKNFYSENKKYYGENWHKVEGLNRNVCARYYCQMALQLEKENKHCIPIMHSLRYASKEKIATLVRFIKTLPLENKMDFVDSAKEKYIRREWKEDKIGFFTFLNRLEKKEIEIPQRKLFGYEGEYSTHFEALDELEEKGDIIQCEKISLEDKMRYFDNW